MDINLPGMDGVEAARQLGENPATRDIPVVAVSAAAMEADIARSEASGIRAYLTKPFSIETVMAVIEQELGENQR